MRIIPNIYIFFTLEGKTALKYYKILIKTLNYFGEEYDKILDLDNDKIGSVFSLAIWLGDKIIKIDKPNREDNLIKGLKDIGFIESEQEGKDLIDKFIKIGYLERRRG